MGQINRRELVQGLALGTLISSGNSALADTAKRTGPSAGPRLLTGNNEQVLPGVWKVSFGNPEPHTPVSLRQFTSSRDALAKLPSVDRTPVSIHAKLSHRGTILRIPLADVERVYGLAPQLHSHQRCSFWTWETVEGGSEFIVGTSLDRVPVYVKGNSIFPMGGIGDSTQDEATRQIVVRVYGDGSLPFILGDSGTASQLWLDSENQSQIPFTVRG